VLSLQRTFCDWKVQLHFVAFDSAMPNPSAESTIKFEPGKPIYAEIDGLPKTCGKGFQLCIVSLAANSLREQVGRHSLTPDHPSLKLENAVHGVASKPAVGICLCSGILDSQFTSVQHSRLVPPTRQTSASNPKAFALRMGTPTTTFIYKADQ